MIKNFLFFRLRRISLWLIIFLICGCSSSKKIIISDALDAVPDVTGSVVNQTAFGKGGNIILGAFEAGANAAADDQTDELSNRVVKGIKDALPDNAPRFTIVPNLTGQTDFLLEGYIQDYGRDTGAAHLKLHGQQVFLAVEGDIWLRQTGERVFLFQSSSVIDLKTQDPDTVAYQMGVAIARYIGAQNN